MAIRRAIHLLILSSVFSLGYAQLQPLGFRPISWSGSKGLDRIIMISASPDLLHIYDPATSSDIAVALPKTPLSLGVTPDGMHAAVGHDGLLTWVDLASASIIKTFTISAQARNVFLGDSYAWYFGALYVSTGGLNGLDLTSGAAVTGPGDYYYATTGVLDATQTSLYLSQDGSSPNDMEKVTITSGKFGASRTWPYHGDYPDCGPYYLSLDGSRIYTSCGTVVHASSDTNLDMYYLRTLPVASFPIAGFAESAGLKKVAVIPSAYQYSYPPNPNADTQVQLFNTDYLTPAGTISLLPFVIPSGSFPAHGKGVFFSKDDTRLFVVVQADSTSNLSNSFGVEVLNLANPLPCAVQLGATVLNVNGAGSLSSLAITATPDCFYTATSSVDWIVLASGAFGSGNGTVQWIVRPNYGSQPRTGTITINSQTYTVQQGPGLPEPLTLERLSFNVVDANYSSSMDRIIAVSTSPDELHIYDPVMGVDSFVPLILPPLAVSVAPDGLHAAVGHDGWISYIDLRTPAVLQVFQIVTDVHHVLLAGNGYIYAFPQRDWSDIYSLEIATGNVTNTSAIYHGRIPRLEPNGKYFYLSSNGEFSKWDITKGVAVSIEWNPGGGLGGSNYWLYQDGSQLISGAGKVYATSDVPAQDVKYTGTYPNVSNISWAANTTTLQSTAIIPLVQGTGPTGPTTTASTQVQFYGDAYLGYTGSLPLPEFSAGGKTYPGDGLFAFWNSTASVLYVIERADPASMLPSTDAIYTINPSAPPSGCAAAPLGPLSTISPTGGFGGTVVMAGAGCAWSATSDSSWLVINAGGIGAGTANVAWSAAPNTGAARSAKVTIGGRGYTVTQLAAGTPQLTISQTSLAFSTTWSATDTIAAQTFTATSGTGPFTVAANPSWISVAMTGSNTFSVSVSPSGLAAGANVGAVTVTSSDGQIQAVIVTLTISPNFVISPASITFQYTVGDPAPSATLSLADGSSSGTPFTAYAQGYVTVTPASGTLPATIQVSANLTFAGTYTSNISIYTGGKNYSVPVKLVVTGVPVSVVAITSDADFTPGPVSPGALVVLWGSGLGPATLTSFTPTPTGAIPPRLAGTTVAFNNYLAPVIYTSKGSVCVIVPYEVAGLSSANVVVSYNGSASAPFTQALAATAPHFFTTTYMPAGQIVGLNSDYSVNSANNPAPAGSVVVLYATGEGVTSPPGVDGTPVGSNLTQPLANVVVMIGGQQGQLLYAGGAPGIVEGVLQVNARIPAGTPSGNVPVSLQIGSASTPAGATIAVK